MEISDSESRKNRSHDSSVPEVALGHDGSKPDSSMDISAVPSTSGQEADATAPDSAADSLGTAPLALAADEGSRPPHGEPHLVEGDDDDEVLAEEQPRFAHPVTGHSGQTSDEMAQSIHDAARQAAVLADSEELKKFDDKRPPEKAIQAAASVLQGLDAGDNRDFDEWLDELDSKLAAASALLDRAAEEKEAMHKVEAEIAAAQKMAAERIEREKKETEKKIVRERRRSPRSAADADVKSAAAADIVAKKDSDAGAIDASNRTSANVSRTASDASDKDATPARAGNVSDSTQPPVGGKSASPVVFQGNALPSPVAGTVVPPKAIPPAAPLPPAPISAPPASRPVTGSKAPSAVPPDKAIAAAVLTAVPQSSTGAPMYDPELADECVKFKRLAFDDRFWRMSKLIMDYAKQTAKNKWLPDRKIPEAVRKRDLAIRFREALVELGPTFIKLGQFLSVRRDLLDPEMADELATLQDSVPPFPADLAIKTIAAELGKEPEKLFLEFDNKPLASASIGQVHRARLHDGREVVVKVQRPDLAAKFYQDLGYMRSLIRWGRRIKPDGDWDGWLALSDEFGRSLFSEIDYLQEGKNADRMRINLRDSGHIRIPRVIWKYTGRHVLAFEYAPGIKIDRIAELKERNFDLVEIGNQLVYAYLEQVLIHGYFHADPHAGNLAIDDEGRIIIYDFGMVGEISEAQRLAIAGCVTSVIDKSGDDVAQYLVELGVLKSDANKAPVVRTLTPFIDYYSGRSMRDLDFTNLERDIDQIALERALKLPANLAYLLRAGSSVEGIARTLQPDFSFVEAAKPFIQRWLLSKPTAFGALLKIFLKYSREAYRSSTEKFANGSGIFGFGRRKNKIHGQEHARAQQPKIEQTLPSSETSASASRKIEKSELRSTSSSVDLPATAQLKTETEEWSQTGIESANQALERDRLNQQRQIYLLETRLQKSVRLQKVLGWSAAGALVFSSLFLIASFLADYQSYVPLFLIGNGVMGAIILWHLVEAALLGNKIQGNR